MEESIIYVLNLLCDIFVWTMIGIGIAGIVMGVVIILCYLPLLIIAIVWDRNFEMDDSID